MILLDTHTLLWYLSDHSLLPDLRKKEISNEQIVCYVNVASLWEIVIKQTIGKLEYKHEVDEIITLIRNSSILILPINPEHVQQIRNLPLHHRDPFDRLLIAQAQKENLTIITKDNSFSLYDIKTLWD